MDHYTSAPSFLSAMVLVLHVLLQQLSTFFFSMEGILPFLLPLGLLCKIRYTDKFVTPVSSEIWQLSRSAFQDKKMDIHTKLMKRYKQVPEWWFISILIASVAITMFTCEYYIEQLQLPWWGVLLACALAIFFTLPIGIVTATTNQVRSKSIKANANAHIQV